MAKRFLALFLSFIMLFNVSAFAADKISVSIDGKNVDFSGPQPFVDENGRTLVPLRKISEELGFEVEWAAEEKKITMAADVKQNPGKEWFDYNYSFVGGMFDKFKKHKSDVEIFSQVYYVDSKIVGIEYSGKGNSEVLMGEIDTCPVIKGGSTYIPARCLVEMIGYEVGWNGAAKHISIDRVR